MERSGHAETNRWSGHRFDLVLGGGGALGAFQAGVYEALEEVGREPDRLVGTSIGALNAALIAGNPRERRLERLHGFWNMVAEPGPCHAAWSGHTRRAAKAVSALRARLLGRPGLYRPHLPRLFLQNPAWGSPSLYPHFGYGAATAALYAAAGLPARAGPGALYGVLVWGASYLGWIPGVRVLEPAARHPAQRNGLMIACHLVWGTTMAVTLRELQRANIEIFAGDVTRDAQRDGWHDSAALERASEPPHAH